MARFAVMLAAAAMLAAGCVGSTGDDDLIGDGLPALAWGEPLLVDRGGDAETSMHIDGDVVLMCSHGGFEQASPVWASTDGGASFTRQTIEPNPIVSGDCDVETLDDGSWVVVYDTIASTTIAVSEDEGASWFLNYLSALPIAVDRPWLASEGNTIVMSYANVMAAEPAIGMVATSDDHGLTWSHVPYAVFESTDRLNHVHGDVLVSDDAWRIAVGRADFNTGQSEGTELDLFTSTDGGGSWTRSPVASTDVDFILPSLAEDGAGTLYYVIPRGVGGSGSLVDLHVAWSTDRGATWTESGPVARNQSLPGVIGPWIDGHPDAGATIAWRNATSDNTTFEAVNVRLGAAAAQTAHDDDGHSHTRDGGAGLQPSTLARSAGGATSSGDAEDHPAAAGPRTLLAGPVQQIFASDHRPGQLYEFLMVDHDEAGTPWVLFVHDDGSGCDPAPNPRESRGSQCLWLVPADAASI